MKKPGPRQIEPDHEPLPENVVKAIYELVAFAISKGAIVRSFDLKDVRAEGLSFGDWEIMVRRVE